MGPRFQWEKADLPDTVGSEWQRGPSPSETRFQCRDTAKMPTAYGPLSYVTDARLRDKRSWEVKQSWHDIGALQKFLKTATSFVERERIEKRITHLQRQKKGKSV
ncbi:hypothetical protein GGR00_004756 [Aminobacter aganoensis]|uniref:Uncharacterized protein n=1 Tax=Aminobacter aganoensis TaxID=83264 RepID=A0A7X0KNA6_9HYPH|nr:hypothetical protein [Aminobacter aganoensis]